MSYADAIKPLTEAVSWARGSKVSCGGVGSAGCAKGRCGWPTSSVFADGARRAVEAGVARQTHCLVPKTHTHTHKGQAPNQCGETQHHTSRSMQDKQRRCQFHIGAKVQSFPGNRFSCCPHKYTHSAHTLAAALAHHHRTLLLHQRWWNLSHTASRVHRFPMRCHLP